MNADESSTNLLVRFLDHSIDDDALRAFFSAHGKIVASIVQRDIHSGQSRGFGFVRFSTHEEATKALTLADGALLGRKNINVLWAKKQHDDIPIGTERVMMNKLFVRNVPLRITEAILTRVFSEFGTVSHVSIHTDTTIAQRSVPPSAQRHIAFITFAEVGAAEAAMKKVHNTLPFKCCGGVPLMCKLSENYHEREHKPVLTAAKPLPTFLAPVDPVMEDNIRSSVCHLNVPESMPRRTSMENRTPRPQVNYISTPGEQYVSKPQISPFRGPHERSLSAISNASGASHGDLTWGATNHITVVPAQPGATNTSPCVPPVMKAAYPVRAPTHLYYSCSAHRARNPGKILAPPPSPRLANSSSSEELRVPSGVSSTPSSGRYFHNPYAISCLDE